MPDAAVIDVRGGLPSQVVKELRRADRMTLVVKDEEAAVLSYAVRMAVPESVGQAGERGRDVLIRRAGNSGPDVAQATVDLAKADFAKQWKRFVGLLRTGDVLTLELQWGQPARLRVGGSSGLYASLFVGQDRGQVLGPTPGMAPETSRPKDRYDKFTERARKVLQLAQEEAQRFNHNYIGTEHLLLGIIREGEGVAAKVLANLGVELNKVRSAVESIIGRGDRTVTGGIGLTPRAKKVIELSVDEARRLNHHYIGTEHLLLGLVREGEGIAAGVLETLGVSLDKVRAAVIRVLNQSASYPRARAEGSGPLAREPASRAIRPRAEATQVARRARFSKQLRRALIAAVDESRRHQHRQIDIDHLLLGLAATEESVAAQAMTRAAVDAQQVREAIEARLEREGSLEPEVEGLTSGTKRVLELAVHAQRHTQQEFLWTLHLLLGLLAADEGRSLLRSLDVPSDAVRGALEGLWGRSRPQLPRPGGPAQP